MDPSSSKLQGTETRHQLVKERDHFRQRTARATEEDDPLALFEGYVKWLLDHETDLSVDDPYEILGDLEEAVRSLSEDAVYKKDLRYLKLWIAYAKHVEDPGVVYTYLIKQEIGTIFCPLYEEFALHLERIGR